MGRIMPIAVVLLAGVPAIAQNAAAPAPLAPGSTAPSASLLFHGRLAPLSSFLAGNRNLVLLVPAACGGSCDAALQAIDKGLL
ncbi:MAG TPA: hypothetical protein VN915_01800, partial [Elusimicrobiota bacterium]|nr:hypothetical protein [Elusimicrobiota bacterium]